MTTLNSLLREIEAFLAEANMKKTTFGLRALNDGTFVRRLEKGDNFTLKTVERVRAYIAANRSPKRRKAA
jgi:hypothetical protein